MPSTPNPTPIERWTAYFWPCLRFALENNGNPPVTPEFVGKFLKWNPNIRRALADYPVEEITEAFRRRLEAGGLIRSGATR